MDLEEIKDIEIVGYTEDSVDQFVTVNDISIDKSLREMPEYMRSMYTELVFIGVALNNPKLVKRYEETVKPKWDFTTDANRFFYTSLTELSKLNEGKISEFSINSYMGDDNERLKLYQKFGGYNWIKFTKKMAEENEADKNVEGFYNLLKNYSLVREYWRMGLREKAEKIVKWKKFKNLKPKEILQYMNDQVNRIYTTLANVEEVKDLTSGCLDYLREKLSVPERGVPMAFPLMTEIFQGLRLGQFMAFGMLSNAGKSRFLIRLTSNLAFVQNKKVLIISNEMTEAEMRACLITTAINNPDIQAVHGIKFNINQNRLQNGKYKADEEYLEDKGVDENGYVVHIFNGEGKKKIDTETPEEFRARLIKMSSEYRKVEIVSKWLDKEMAKKILIIETGSEYSDTDLKQIIENTTLSEEIEYIFYDTFKSDKDSMGEWVAMKKTATILSEIAKKNNLFIGANIQLTDDTVKIEPSQLSSNNIANSKQIKQVLDSLCLIKEIPESSLKDYEYKESNSKALLPVDLEKNKRYYYCVIDKNRIGEKPHILFEIDLDTNIWTEKGYAYKK